MIRKILGASVATVALAIGAEAQGVNIDEMNALATEVNTTLEQQGADYRLVYMEYYLAEPGESPDEARIVFFDNRGNKQLDSQFVPGDTRRSWGDGDPNTIEWSNDFDYSADLPPADQDAAIASAMATWDAQSCSDPELSGGQLGFDTGVIEFLFLGGGSPFVFADIQNSGFLPAGTLGAGVLGVHFAFNFIDPVTGELTDIDENGYSDKAFGDIYYNDAFDWSSDGSTIYDYETVALHENGHGLSQEHFGSAFATPSNGKVHFNPRAVMNAAYSGIQRELAGTDNAGHCSLWANWPN